MFVVHRAERASHLADGLSELLSTPLSDPFAPELVAVPAQGVERWLAQRLSLRLGSSNGNEMSAGIDGVCTNVRFLAQRSMLDEAIVDGSPEIAAQLAMWTPARLTWSVLTALDENLDADWCRLPRRHLFPDGVDETAPPDRRLGLASRVARLFDAYAHSRPEMLSQWAGGNYLLADGTLIGDQEQWQPRLWRSVLNLLGGTSPIDLHEQLILDVRANPDSMSLPARLSVFGPSRVSRRDLELLSALSEHRDVHLWLHHSSPSLWDAVAGAPDAIRRAEDVTPLSNPLLRSLSRDVRELQMLLRRYAPEHMSIHHPPSVSAGNDTMLTRLRADLAEDRVPESAAAVQAADRSVQVHACHGRIRQVEVLREIVVGLLADDPTLEPRDVLVMCPDIELFTPLLSAVFAPGPQAAPTHPAEKLRVHIADRALHQSNPVLAVLKALLELGAARCTVNEVLGFAELPAVARRFGWSDDAGEQLRGWAAASGVRWGMDDAHRSEWRLQTIKEGTWRRGLDRLLLGAAFESDDDKGAQIVAGLLPVDAVDSSDLDLLGRFVEFLDRVDAAHTALTQPHTAAEWAEILHQMTTGLALPDPDAPWQAPQLREILQEIFVDNAADGSPQLSLTLQEIGPALRDAFAGRPTRAGFRTGALTVCELVPMRSVPHRVVVILGLDDGAFPRQSVRDGDDLLARDPWIGDRDPRSEDRQLLLDAINAAHEQLILIYTGHDQRTGAPVPPAVPLGELLDAIDRTVIGTNGSLGSEVVTIHHPLQPFDPRAFTPGALGTDRPFSFDPSAHSGATSVVGDRADAPLLAAELLPAPALADIALDDLVALLCQPARGFLRQRLQVSTAEVDPHLDDSLPLELNSLEQWALGERVLLRRLAGMEALKVRELELARDALPPGPLGVRELETVGPRADVIANAAAALTDEPESYDIAIDLGDGTRLVGTVNHVRGTCLVGIGYAGLSPRHRFAAWVRLLALTTSRPSQPWQAVTLGLDANRSSCSRSVLQNVPSGTATALIHQYVALYREGLRAPLPVPARTAEAYAVRRSSGTAPVHARVQAATPWNSRWQKPGEQSDEAHVLLFGGTVPFETVLREPAHADDYFRGWPADEEGDRFGVLSRRLWDPLLTYETRDAL